MKKIEYESKQVVVKNKKVKWACEICGKEYRHEGDAYTCEQIHRNKEILNHTCPICAVGDVIVYHDSYNNQYKYSKVFKIKPSTDYLNYMYTVSYGEYTTDIFEGDIVGFVYSANAYIEKINNLKKDFSNKLNIPVKNIQIELMLLTGQFKISFTSKPVSYTKIHK